MRAISATLLVLVLLVAGCTDSPEDAQADAMADAQGDEPLDGAVDGVATEADLEDTVPPLAFTACTQFHASFVGRAEDFQDQVPDGYELVTYNNGLVDLYVFPTACDLDGDEASQMWISLLVVPPAELADDDALHQLALEGYADEVLANEFHSRGIHMIESCDCGLTGDQAEALGFAAHNDEDHYILQTALSPSDAPFDMPAMWLYVPSNGVVTHRIHFGAGASTEVGLGAAALAYEGPGGAPPAHAGNPVHVIHEFDFDLFVEEVA